MTFSENTFCTLPWSSIEISPSGDYKVCMFFGNLTDPDLDKIKTNEYAACVDDNGITMNVMTHSIQDAINSKYHKEVRLFQASDKRYPMCKTCWDRDDANARANLPYNSVRHYKSAIQFKQFDGAISITDANAIIKKDGSIDNIPISLDLRFTNVCNMKCIMCSPQYSNMWYEDWTKIMNTNEFYVGNKTYTITNINNKYDSNIVSWHDSPEWMNRFDEIKHRIRHLYITGGEPFVVKGHDKILDKLIECDFAKNVTLEYDTNLSVINEKLLDKLKKFKTVNFYVSCDDVFAQYEYIRFPGKFSVIQNNLKIIKEHGFNVFHLSTCIGIYSMFSPIRLYETFGDSYDYSLRFLSGPHSFDIAFLPDDAKEKVIFIYENVNMPHRWKQYVISHLKNNMNVHSHETCYNHTMKFISYMDKLDSIRGTNWKSTFPDVVKILNKYIKELK